MDKNTDSKKELIVNAYIDKENMEDEQRETLNRYILILKYFPLVVIIIIILFLLAMLHIIKSPISIYILLAIFIFLLVRELATLLFVYRMHKNIIRPLESLQRGVEEVTGGNYGYTIDGEDKTSLAPLITSFNQMSCQLKEVQDTNEKYELNRKKLLAGISHDLKTPITSILGYIEGINEGVANSPEKMNMYMDIIYKNAKYTNTLIDDLFLFSKLDINQMKYQLQKINVKDYFDDIFIEKKIDFEEKGNKVEYFSSVDADMEMCIDPKMVYRVVSNLISNAIKYNDKEQVVLKCRLEKIDGEDGIKVTVRDNGMGIEEKEINHIFDVFYRVDKARNKDIGGSGLGLAISEQLVEAHDGSITARSVLGEWTEFSFTIYDQKNKM